MRNYHHSSGWWMITFSWLLVFMDRILWHLCMITSFLWAWPFGDESWDNVAIWWIRQSNWRSVLSECEWQKGNEVSIFQRCQQTAAGGLETTQWTPTFRPLRRMGRRRRRSKRRCWTWRRRSRGRGAGRRLASRPPCRCHSIRWTFDLDRLPHSHRHLDFSWWQLKLRACGNLNWQMLQLELNLQARLLRFQYDEDGGDHVKGEEDGDKYSCDEPSHLL